MHEPRLATLCLCDPAADVNSFRCLLDDVLEGVPPAGVELRLGLSRDSPLLHHALGLLCPDGGAPEFARLPGGGERFRGVCNAGLPFCCWAAPPGLPGEALLRLLWCDLPLATGYVVRLDAAELLPGGWWSELSGLLAGGADVVGPLSWCDLLPSEADSLRGRSWHRGLPWLTRGGRPGVWAAGGLWAAYRVESLRQAGLLDDWPRQADGAAAGRLSVWLGALARQLGWRQQPAPDDGGGLPSPDVVRG